MKIYQYQLVDKKSSSADDEVNTGVGGSYTMGSISMKYGLNSLSSKGGSATAEDIDASIFSVSFAF